MRKLSDKPKRRAMTPARKRRLWEREDGICWVCKLPVEMSGPGVVYDHRGTLFITESDDDAGIFPIHRDPCDKTKTPGDLKRIGKTRRQSKMRLDVPRPEPTMKGPGKPLMGRGFPKRGTAQKIPSRPIRGRNSFKR